MHVKDFWETNLRFELTDFSKILKFGLKNQIIVDVRIKYAAQQSISISPIQKNSSLPSLLQS